MTEHRLRPVEPEIREDPRTQEFCAALAAAAGDRDLLLAFLRDLLTQRELRDLANRWAVARHLMAGRTQTATARELAISTKTVNEMAAWVHGLHARNGYWGVLERLPRRDAEA